MGVGAPLAIILLAAFVLLFGKTPPCIFYEATGLLCPGCGTGRAVIALLHLDLYAAFRYNHLFLVFSPFLSYYLAKLYIAFVFGKDVLPFPQIRSSRFAIAMTALIIAYWILRNIPFFPFTLLNPNIS